MPVGWHFARFHEGRNGPEGTVALVASSTQVVGQPY